MDLKLSDFWSWEGKVGRAKYAGFGIGLCLIKLNIDRVVTGLMGYGWSLDDYWIFGAEDVASISARQMQLYAVLVTLALPFIWTGIVLTIRRLRDAHLPTWLVVFFFVPFVNLLFFLMLLLVPSASPEETYSPVSPGFGATVSRMIPSGEFGSALMGILITALMGVVLTVLSVYGLAQYGWGLFVGIPFFLGLNSVLIYGVHEPRPLGKCLLVALIGVALVGVVIFFIAIEGLICLLMAAPLASVLALFGGFIGFLLQRRESYSANVFPALLFFFPGMLVIEPAIHSEPPRMEVKTSVIVDADRATVWKNVVSFSELPPPTERLFKAGIAYPIRAEIQGQGVGAIRQCVFSTGAFVEPITIWDEPRLLRFDVSAQPRVMDEWSVYPNLRPPHVETYLVSRQGQFLLTEMADGRTLLEGTTVYQNRFWPAPYWRLWSDFIIHRIHHRVLVHIKDLSEGQKEL